MVMKKCKIFLQFLIFTLLLTIIFGCSSDDDIQEKYIWVAPEYFIMNNGHEDGKYLKIKIIEENNAKETVIPGIAGLGYEEGYSYILYVRIEPNVIAKDAPDAFPYIYTLIRVISKDHLPPPAD